MLEIFIILSSAHIPLCLYTTKLVGMDRKVPFSSQILHQALGRLFGPVMGYTLIQFGYLRSCWKIFSVLSSSHINFWFLPTRTGASIKKQRSVKKQKADTVSSSSSFSKKRKPVVSGNANNVNYNRDYFS